jgi:hypothetical protein
VRKLCALVTMLAALWLVPFANATPAGKRAVIKVFGHSHTALCVAKRESRFIPWKISRTDDWGLFQINRPTWFGKVIHYKQFRLRVQKSRIRNALYNARVAYIISRGGTSWAAWAADERYCL